MSFNLEDHNLNRIKPVKPTVFLSLNSSCIHNTLICNTPLPASTTALSFTVSVLSPFGGHVKLPAIENKLQLISVHSVRIFEG